MSIFSSSNWIPSIKGYSASQWSWKSIYIKSFKLVLILCYLHACVYICWWIVRHVFLLIKPPSVPNALNYFMGTRLFFFFWLSSVVSTWSKTSSISFEKWTTFHSLQRLFSIIAGSITVKCSVDFCCRCSRGRKILPVHDTLCDSIECSACTTFICPWLSLLAPDESCLYPWLNIWLIL